MRLIFLASGVAGLGYQVSWLRQFSVGIGHELPSAMAVVSAFLAGLALGAFLLDKRISASARPGAWYAGLEVGIGLWSLVTILILPELNDAVVRWIGIDPSPWRHWSLAFALPFLALLPATMAMGGTFPAMERLAARLSGSGRNVASLYAINTAGALLGTLGITHFLLPSLGSGLTLGALALVNFACAAATWFGPSRDERELVDSDFQFVDAPSGWRLGALVFSTGLFGIGFEILAVRTMGQVLENTVYSFASGLSMYLAGTALGAAIYSRFLGGDRFQARLVQLLTAVVCAVALALLILPASTRIYAGSVGLFGMAQAGAVLSELSLAAAVFLLPAACMGALFSHLVQAARRSTGGVGRAMATNLLGGALASLAFGLLLLPEFGAGVGLVVVCAGYLVLMPRQNLERTGLLGAVVAGLFFLSPPLRLVAPPPGGRVIAYEEGVLAAVAVVADAGGNRAIKVNDRFTMGGSARGFAEWREAHLPILLHPEPQNALFLGVGAGATAQAATLYPELAVEAVELIPEVVKLLPLLDTGPDQRWVRSAVRYHLADARRYVRASEQTYDVIVADLYQPARDGSGALYTTEHFRAIAERLNSGGLFCQWLPLYQMDREVLALIVRTFLDVYPDAFACMAHFNLNTPILGLFSQPVGDYGEGWFDRRTVDFQLKRGLEVAALRDDFDLFGCFVASAAELAAFAGPGALNTDDHPRVVFEAPRFAYDKRNDTFGRMLALLEASGGDPAPLLSEGGAALEEFGGRLGSYLKARDLYLKSTQAALAGEVDRQVDLLLESSALSPDFETSFVVAIELSHSPALTKAATERLLGRLRELRPGDTRIPVEPVKRPSSGDGGNHRHPSR